MNKFKSFLKGMLSIVPSIEKEPLVLKPVNIGDSFLNLYRNFETAILANKANIDLCEINNVKKASKSLNVGQ